MKKLFIIALLLTVSVVAQQNISGTISQPVVGSFVLGAYQNCIGQDRQMLFGPTGPDNISANDCFRIDFFEVNGMLTGCEDELCDLVTTLNDELQLTTPHTSKETALIDDLLIQLDDSTTCLLGVYNGSMFNGTAGSIRVGAKTYFNTVKPCYVRTIAALGSLEQIYIDEPNASFLVQKLQALEVDYQQLLTMEDLKAIKIFNVTNATLTGTVTGAPEGINEMFFKDDALFNPVAGADYWSAKWTECDGESQLSCFETQKISLSQNYLNLICDPISNYSRSVLTPPITVNSLVNCNVWSWTEKEILECNCYNMVVNRIMEIDNCFNATEIPACPDPNYPGQPSPPNFTNTCKQCLNGGLYPVGGQVQPADLGECSDDPYTVNINEPSQNNYEVTLTETSAAALFDKTTPVYLVLITAVGETDYQTNTIIGGGCTLSGEFVQKTTSQAQYAMATVVCPPSSSPITFTVTSPSTVTEAIFVYTGNVCDNTELLGNTDPNAAYLYTGSGNLYYTVTNPLLAYPAKGYGNPGMTEVRKTDSDTITSIVGSGSTTANGISIVTTISPSGTGFSTDVPDTTTTFTAAPGTIAMGAYDINLFGVQGVFNNGDPIVITSTTALSPNDLGGFSQIWIPGDAGSTNNMVLMGEGAAPPLGYIDLKVTNFVAAPSGTNTFDVDSNTDPGGEIPEYAMSIAWTDPLGHPSACTQPTVPIGCSVTQTPSTPAATGLLVPVVFCQFNIQCPAFTSGPQTFSFSPVGIAVPPNPIDNAHMVGILRPDQINSNNFHIGTGTGIVIAVPFLDNPIVGSSPTAFWLRGSMLAGTTFQHGIGLAGEYPNKLDVVSCSIGPPGNGALVGSNWVGPGPVTIPPPIVTAGIGGDFDFDVSYAYGLAIDGDLFNVVWPAVSPLTLSDVAITVANGKGDADFENNAIAMCQGYTGMPTSITGSAFADLGEGNATVALLMAGVIVVILFLFMLRKKD